MAPPPQTPSSTTVLQLSCHCKTFESSIAVPPSSLPLISYTCSCSLCRHVTGNLFTAWLGTTNLDVDDLFNAVWSNHGITAYVATPRLTYAFCRTCGANVAYRNHEGGFAISSGTVTDWKGIAPPVRLIEYLDVEHTGDGNIGVWLSDPDRYPKYSGIATNTEPLTTEAWAKIPDAKRPKADSPSTRLDFYCHCRGVQGHITRCSESQIGHADRKWWWLSADESTNKWNSRKKMGAALCPCTSCRSTSGHEFFAWPYCAAENLFFDERQLENFDDATRLPAALKVYSSSPTVYRYFCGTCGAKVLYRRDSRVTPPVVVDIAAGLCDSDAGSRVDDWFYWGSAGYKEGATDQRLLKDLDAGIKAWEKNEAEYVGESTTDASKA